MGRARGRGNKSCAASRRNSAASANRREILIVFNKYRLLVIQNAILRELSLRQDGENDGVGGGRVVAQFDVQGGFGRMRNAEGGIDEAGGDRSSVGELLVGGHGIDQEEIGAGEFAGLISAFGAAEFL